jgi:hypothetical protein
MITLRWLWLDPLFYVPICLKEEVGVSAFVKSNVELQQFVTFKELDLFSNDAEQVTFLCSKLIKYEHL